MALFVLPAMLAIAAPAHAADTGGVSTALQKWAGKKLLLMDAINIETLAAGRTLTIVDQRFQNLDPGGASRDVTLPSEDPNAGAWFWIINGADAAENLVIKDDGGSTIVTIQQSQAGIVVNSGTAWKGFAFQSTAAGTLQADGTVAGATSQAQDFGSNGVKADVVAESTGAAGVTVDSVLLKDGDVYLLDSGDDHTIQLLSASDEGGNRTLTIPALGGNDTLVVLGTAQTLSGAKTFSHQTLLVNDSADDNAITIEAAADEAGDYTLAIPDLAGNDTLGTLATTQTYAGAKTFSGGIVPSAITGQDASLDVAGLAGSGGGAGGTIPVVGGAGHTNGAGGLVSLTGGAGAGTGNGGASSLVGGASGAGATGAGGAIAITGGASAATNGAGGANVAAGGAGAGTGNGGLASVTGGASGAGATGNGGAASLVGGASGATDGAGGAVAVTGGAGAGTGAGGAITNTAGASGAGATGNGGAVANIGGAATSTNGSGGASNVTGGLSTGTGTGGGITLISGASAGAGGTAGSISADTGAAAGGTAGTISIGTTNSGAVEIGRTGQALTLSSTVSATFGNTALKIFDAGGDHTLNFTTATDEAGSYTVTVPDLAGNDTLMTLATAQTVIGVKTFPVATLFTAGGSATTQRVRGLLDIDTTAVGNVDGGEDDLITYVMPADVFNAAGGRAIKVRAWGITAANASNKTIKLYFGTAQAITSSAAAANDKDWMIEMMVARTGTSTQDVIGYGNFNEASLAIAHTEPTENETATITIKATGESAGAATDDIVCHGMMVELLD